MKNKYQSSIITLAGALIFSMNTNALAANVGNGTILEDVNRLAEEIIEDIAQSQTNAGNELAEHDTDIKGEISAHDESMALAHENLADDYESLVTTLDQLNSKLDQIVEASGTCHAEAWDKTIDTADRFELVMGGEAVLDHETCLVWQQAPDTETKRWDGAIAQCIVSNTGNRFGWRLPTVEEISTLATRDFPGQILPLDHPFDVQKGKYWTTSNLTTLNTVNVQSDTMWIANFSVTADITLAAKTRNSSGGLNYWCVRGGQGNEAYTHVPRSERIHLGDLDEFDD